MKRGLLRRRGALQRFGRGGIFAVEILLPRELQRGELKLRLPVGELRLLVEQLRAIAVDFGLVYRGVDLGEELPGRDDGADFHEQLLELAGDLRADVDEVLGLERSGRGDRVLEITALGHRGDEAVGRARLAKSRAPRMVAAAGQQRARGKDERPAGGPRHARSRTLQRATRQSVPCGNRGFGIRSHACSMPGRICPRRNRVPTPQTPLFGGVLLAHGVRKKALHAQGLLSTVAGPSFD